MSSPSILEIDALLAPIAGDNPAGEEVPFDVPHQLDAARKEKQWGDAIDLATETLNEKSKDLQVAAHLTIALTGRDEFAGLREGLTLLTRLIKECWERMRPVAEEGESLAEARVGTFNWINDGTRGATFPAMIQGLPLIRVKQQGEEVSYSFFDWQNQEKRAEFEAAIPKADLATVKQKLADVEGCEAQLKALSDVLDEKFGDESPNLTSLDTPSNLGTALRQCASVAKEIHTKLGGDEPPPEEPPADDEVPKKESGGSSGPMPTSREGLYKELERIAGALKRIEPHSPIPYLLERAVRLGRMPYPLMMRELMKDSSAVGGLEEMLGIIADQE